ncbi:hypothetical protein LTR56_005816 [Elasticomyces elasticus]|nr:hypothetical protein LTR22_019427 [Elasticomyces elasticus]KAK3651359.1 hypothetical protein LTR56_005816 [Elasticomyces elasticus]KAK4925747.1 hypothetical protein LTR49_007357 [Elasticomyces elasticus]KAK5765079.1 hypothetical protein LTS12_004857 [Elasticomyces elasticus]
MSQLLALPAELLDAVMGYTLPDGLESLVLSCKKIYSVAKDHVHTHELYKRRWRNFHYGNTDHGIRVPIQLLLAIANDPLVARYIQTADFWQKMQDDDAFVESTELVLMNDTSMAAIGSLLKQSHYLRQAKQDPSRWLANMRNNDDDQDCRYWANLCTAILLTLLPDLRELTLPREWRHLPDPRDSDDASDPYFAKELWSVLDLIPREATSASWPLASLSKLQRVLPYGNINYDDKNALEELSPFLSLDSLEELHASNCVAVDDDFTGYPFHWRYPVRLSNLRTIELAGCCIDSEGIAALVAHTPKLETLKYSHATKWHGCQYDWSAGEFVSTIAQHCGTTLKELAVTIDYLSGMIETGVTSMQAFLCLESVELDIMIFAGPPAESGKRQGLDTEDYKIDISQVPRLTDILPQTMKHVKLFVPSHTGDADNDIEFDILASLFRQYATQQSLCQPDLVGLSIGFEHVYGWRDDIRRTFDAHTDSHELIPLLNQWQGNSIVNDGLTWAEDFRKRYDITKD